ncbi:MAG TPA: dipeptidase [bacterium]|jgi:membrane dipeptidase|nr:dipeptidase [bacterium]
MISALTRGLIAVVVLAAIPQSILQLHRDAVVVDLHSDTLLAVQSGARGIGKRSSVGHIDLPRLREGGMDVQVFAAFIHPRESSRGFARATELIDAFDRMISEHRAAIGRATTVSEIEALVRSGRVAAVLSIENGDALGGSPANLDTLYRRGVRVMGLTWNASNDLADGALEHRHSGLTPLGKMVVRRMQQLGIVVDVSHLSEKSFWDVLAATTGPVMATHSDAAAVVPHPRNLTDAQLRALAGRGGLVGVNFYPAHAGGGSIERILRQIDYMVKIMGVEHVGLGSDFDGFNQQVRGLEDVSKLPNLTAGLAARGYTPDQIKKILGGNALRVFKQVWGK